MINLLIALLLTQIFELLIAYIFWFKKRIELLTLFFINLFSNPLANLLFWVYYHQLNKFLLIAIIEIGVILAEAFLIKIILRKKLAKALLISLVINLFSFLLGFLILL